MNEMNATIDGLGTVAANVAMKAAVEYVRVHRLQYDAEALCNCIKSWCKIMLPQALKDAKEAIDCGMTAIAEMTFKATMAKAGIEAAREAGMPLAGEQAKYLPSAL